MKTFKVAKTVYYEFEFMAKDINEAKFRAHIFDVRDEHIIGNSVRVAPVEERHEQDHDT